MYSSRSIDSVTCLRFSSRLIVAQWGSTWRRCLCFVPSALSFEKPKEPTLSPPAEALERRRRLAEAVAHRRGLEKTLAPYHDTAKLVHLDATGQSERVVDAIRATADDTQANPQGSRDNVRAFASLYAAHCADAHRFQPPQRPQEHGSNERDRQTAAAREAAKRLGLPPS